MEGASLQTLSFVISLFFCTTNQARLAVSSTRSQLFERESLFMKCEDDDDSAGWTVKRNTSRQHRSQCGDKWGRAKNLICLINNVDQWDSGVYWCESSSGSSSSSISITVSAWSFIGLPVCEGLRLLSRPTRLVPAFRTVAEQSWLKQLKSWTEPRPYNGGSGPAWTRLFVRSAGI